ncbi:7 transmembrane receptor (rhodopsin family) domain-containing protein [Ditylenchus destructor]|nr:7 transmembrane receptor (rhodopsin family) domain-containing protein [Ditylenchus destructor]
MRVPTQVTISPSFNPNDYDKIANYSLSLDGISPQIFPNHPISLRNLLRDHPRLAAYVNHFTTMNESYHLPSSILLGDPPYHEPEECVHYVERSPDPTNSPAMISIFAFIYINIFIMGLVGNLSIVCLTCRHRHLRTVQNMFIMNLAISDVIVCLISLPFTPVNNIYKNWLFGQPICQLLPLVQAVSVFVSTFSLSAIAIDRYNLVVRPYAHPLKIRGAVVVAIILWVLSVFISMPYAYYMQLEEYPGYCGQFCTEQWPNQGVRRGYALIVLILQFLVPFITMSFCYATIFSRLRQRANTKLRKLNERSQLLFMRNGELAKNEKGIDSPVSITAPVAPSPTPSDARHATDEGDQQKRVAGVTAQQRRTTTILAAMVLMFGLAWLPQNVITLIIEYDESILHSNSTNYTYLVSMIAHSIAMLANVANPMIYGWLNPTFKRLFLEAFRRKSNKEMPLSNSPTNKSFGEPSKVGTVVKINGLKTEKQEPV